MAIRKEFAAVAAAFLVTSGVSWGSWRSDSDSTSVSLSDDNTKNNMSAGNERVEKGKRDVNESWYGRKCGQKPGDGNEDKCRREAQCRKADNVTFEFCAQQAEEIANKYDDYGKNELMQGLSDLCSALKEAEKNQADRSDIGASLVDIMTALLYVWTEYTGQDEGEGGRQQSEDDPCYLQLKEDLAYAEGALKQYDERVKES